jgi:hypothetical protein
MRLNNGLGDVVPGKKAIFPDSANCEKMALVKGNNCDVWLMVRSLTSFSYKAFHITNTGIDLTPVVSNIGIGSPYLNSYGVGEIMFSHDGKKWRRAILQPEVRNFLTLMQIRGSCRTKFIYIASIRPGVFPG